MATVLADLATNQAATPPVKSSAAKLGGRVRIFKATYTQGAAAGTIGDVINFGTLPAGATPLIGGKMFFGTGTASATLKVGLTGNDACFVAATAINAAGSASLEAFAASGADLSPLTADTAVIGTNAVAAIAANQKITVHIPYVMND